MNTIPFAKDLYLYTGSTFDGCISLEDIHGKPFYISEGYEIIFFVKKSAKTDVKETTQSVKELSLTLTADDEVMGEYPFKLDPETTETLSGDYYYYVSVRFADGDYYQIVPYTPLHASIPYAVIQYNEDKNKIKAKVPRVMAEIGYEPAVSDVIEFMEDVQNQNNPSVIHMRHIRGSDIILINDRLKPNELPPAELVAQISDKIEYYGANNPFIAGFFHSSVNIYQKEYKATLKETFNQRYIDVEEILKTPVLSEHSEMIVSSIAFDLIRQKPASDDILKITHGEYPECIMQDETHFNEKGRYAAAKIILKEAIHNGI